VPEGDNLYRAATALQRALAGGRVVSFRTSEPVLRSLVEDRPVEGRRVEKVEARGKNLLVFFDDGRALRTHLRMSGSWHLYRSGERWQRPERQARCAIETDGGFVAVCFNAPVVQLVTPFELRATDVARLGPDATTDSFDAGEALRRMRERPEAMLCEALIAQRVLAGVGNVIKSEALFLRSLDPFRCVGDVPEADVTALIAEAHRQLVANRSHGPRTTRRALTGPRLWVYRRAGESCLRCGAIVRMRRAGQGLRSTYFCPSCQR
jgi:endonuclease VIII